MHRIINAVRGNIVAWLALFVALGVAVPTIASANCPTPTKPPHCWEVGIEPTSGACARYLKEVEEEEAAYVRCERELAEVHEKYEREIREAHEKYEREIQKAHEQQVAEEQQAKRQADERYAREHPSPPPTTPPTSVTRPLPQFEGEIEPATGSHSGHRWKVRSRIVLRFVDRRYAHTRYRLSLSWSSRLFWRVTGTQGVWSRIPLTAPHKSGRYSVTWRVNGQVVARWKFDAVR
jgi:hypothetical protein